VHSLRPRFDARQKAQTARPVDAASVDDARDSVVPPTSADAPAVPGPLAVSPEAEIIDSVPDRMGVAHAEERLPEPKPAATGGASVVHPLPVDSALAAFMLATSLDARKTLFRELLLKWFVSHGIDLHYPELAVNEFKIVATLIQSYYQISTVRPHYSVQLHSPSYHDVGGRITGQGNDEFGPQPPPACCTFFI